MSLIIHAGKNAKSLFVTNERVAARHAAEKENSGKRNTIFAGDIGVRPDSIQMKRQQAQKKAMKILKDTFAGDRELDQSIQGMADRADELQKQTAELRKELGEIAATRKELAENYGIEGDSRETEYLELDEKEEYLRNQIRSGEQGVKSIRSSIRDTKLERLKSDPMLKAQSEAEEVIMQANKEIYADLMNEGKKHIEEKIAEEKEKAEKIAEKKEEEEEKEAKRKEQEAQMEAWIEGTKEAAESDKNELPSASELDEMYSYNNLDAAGKTKADKEIEQMLEEMKLLQDDIKGAAIDAGL